MEIIVSCSPSALPLAPVVLAPLAAPGLPACLVVQVIPPCPPSPLGLWLPQVPCSLSLLVGLSETTPSASVYNTITGSNQVIVAVI